MPVKLDIPIRELGYQMIERSNAYYTKTTVLRTKDRNALMAESIENFFFMRGYRHNLVSKSLGGGLWECHFESEGPNA